MKLDTKIWILVILFGIRGILYLISGIFGIFDGASYGVYGSDLVNAGIMGYIAYLLHTTRNKWAYWMTAIFTGFTLIQFVFDAALITSSGIAPSWDQAIVIALIVLPFGIAPLILLLNKEIRAAYLTKN